MKKARICNGQKICNGKKDAGSLTLGSQDASVSVFPSFYQNTFTVFRHARKRTREVGRKRETGRCN